MIRILVLLLALWAGPALAQSISTSNPVTPYVGPTAWTPTDASGAALTLTGISANYTRIGNMVFAYASFAYPVTADASVSTIGGFPIAFPAPGYSRQCTLSGASVSAPADFLPNAGASTGAFKSLGLGNITNAQMSGATVFIMCVYPAT